MMRHDWCFSSSLYNMRQVGAIACSASSLALALVLLDDILLIINVN